jgi:hypothetical protein
MDVDGTVLQSGPVSFTKDANWKMAGVGDFNGDGTSDVLIRHSVSQGWYAYLMDVDGTVLQSGPMPFTSDKNWKMAGVGDFNGDGTSDVLIRHSVSQGWYVYLMDVDGTVLQSGPLPFTNDVKWQMAGVGDLNGDGTSDVLVRHSVSKGWYVYLMDVGGTILQSVPLPFTSDKNWQMAGVGDFNGDGTSDVLIRHSVSQGWYVYLMDIDGTVLQSGPVPFTSDKNWKMAGVGDFNGDGTSDVLVRHSVSQGWYAYLMDVDGTVLQSGPLPFTKDANWQPVIY